MKTQSIMKKSSSLVLAGLSLVCLIGIGGVGHAMERQMIPFDVTSPGGGGDSSYQDCTLRFFNTVKELNQCMRNAGIEGIPYLGTLITPENCPGLLQGAKVQLFECQRQESGPIFLEKLVIKGTYPTDEVASPTVERD